MSSREITVAVVQMSMSPDVEANVVNALARVAEAADRGAGLVLLPELFENLYWCQVQREEYFAGAHPLDGHPFLPALPGPRAGTARRPAGQLLRAGRPGALQQPGDDRRDGLDPGRLSQVAHPGWSRVHGEVLLQPRRHRVPGVLDRGGHRRRGDLLGPVVPGDRARDGAPGRGDPALPDRHRFGARRSRAPSTRPCCGGAP